MSFWVFPGLQSHVFSWQLSHPNPDQGPVPWSSGASPHLFSPYGFLFPQIGTPSLEMVPPALVWTCRTPAPPPAFQIVHEETDSVSEISPLKEGNEPRDLTAFRLQFKIRFRTRSPLSTALPLKCPYHWMKRVFMLLFAIYSRVQRLLQATQARILEHSYVRLRRSEQF